MEPTPDSAESAARKPKLLQQVRTACRARQFSERTAEAYTGWIRRYVLYPDKRHPRDLDASAIAAFLTHQADDRDVSVSTPLVRHPPLDAWPLSSIWPSP